MRKEGITKHLAILKAKDLIGEPGDPGPQKSNPASDMKPELTTDHRTEVLTEAFTHFVRSLNAKPEKAISYLGSRKLDYKKLAIGYDAGFIKSKKPLLTKSSFIYNPGY